MKRSRSRTERVTPSKSEPKKKIQTSRLTYDGRLNGLTSLKQAPLMSIEQPKPYGSSDNYNAGAILASLRLVGGKLLKVVSFSAAEHHKALEHKLSFPEKVYAMVAEAACRYPDAIRWIEDGAGFQVCNKSNNLVILLRKYFKHGNYASLQRQLNMYGWKKQAYGPHKGAFFNVHFHRDRASQADLALISRRPPPLIARKPRSSSLSKQSVSEHQSKSILAGPKFLGTTSATPTQESANKFAVSYAQVTPFCIQNGKDKENSQRSNSNILGGVTVIAGSTSCITSESVLWSSCSYQNSVTPRVQNPRDRRRPLFRLHPSCETQRMRLFIDRTHNTAPKTGAIDSEELQRKDKIRPAWISPNLNLGSGGGNDENSFPSRGTINGLAGKIPACQIEGGTIPMTPILVRRLPTEDQLYDSPTMPAPIALLRRQSSNSFLEPFVGTIRELSRALDVEYTEQSNDISGYACLIKCEPVDDADGQVAIV